MSNPLGFNVEGYSKNEAFHTFHKDHQDCPKAKEFWRIDSCQNNLVTLQSLIDVLYNETNPTNRVYSVEILKQQSSSRLTIMCHVCNKNLSSYDPFTSHDQGKAHKRMLLQAREDVNPNKVKLNMRRPKGVYGHFECGTLEYLLDQTTHAVIGYHMLYGEKYEEQYFYTCRLCSVRKFSDGIKRYTRMVMREAFDHVLSDTHNQNYLEVKHNYKTRNTGSNEFHNEIREVQKLEGTIFRQIETLHNSDMKMEIKKEQNVEHIPKFKAPKLVVKLPEMKNMQVQTVENDENMIEFTKNMVVTQMEMCTKKDAHPWARLLDTDRDAREILCCFLVIMSEKLVKFAERYDMNFQDHARRLANKCKELKYDDLD